MPITTTYRRRRTNHGLHFVLTLFTCGAWGLVWVTVWGYNSLVKEKTTTVTEGWHR